MDSVNKKLEEDYQQLFILLKKKYKKQIFDVLTPKSWTN